jgi:diguanylate cyclase (GGDEF)-like protein/putative nucleotidyltransferase with HDIG domain
MPAILELLGQGSPSVERSPRGGAPAVRSVTPGFATRAQAALFALAGAVGAMGVLLPHPARFDEAGMLTVQLVSILIGAAMLALRERTPRWLTVVGPYAGSVATAAAVCLSGSSTSPYLLFYMWICFYAFAFLSPRAGLALAVFSMATYAAVIVAFRAGIVASPTDNTNEDVAALVLLTGTILVAGAFIVVLRDRIGALIGQLSKVASTDPLTGLLNRRGFNAALESELDRSERNGRPFSLLRGDFDLFKDFNDSLGHHAGDSALLTVAQMLEGDRRRIDAAARIGGEEFALVLPETDQHEAYLVAERLRVRIAEMFGDEVIPLTISFGVATYPEHATTDDGLIRAAGDALYAAKELGRDRSVLHSDEVADILSSGREAQVQRDKAQLSTVLNLAEALDMRDSGTARHSQTVGRYCELMARELGLTPDRVNRVRIAGVLHDIGKIGVADAILCKPGPLTGEEYEAMKKHPEIGARILSGTGLDDIRGWVLAHHERPDGHGYPFGLAETEIPLEARILAVADAYEAMTSDRVYRRSIGAEAARAELLRWSGHQFDAEVVQAFLGALARSPSRSAVRSHTM